MRIPTTTGRLGAALAAVAMAGTTALVAAPPAASAQAQAQAPAATVCGGERGGWLDAGLVGTYDGSLATGETVRIRLGLGLLGHRAEMSLDGEELPSGRAAFAGAQAGGPKWTWTTVAFGVQASMTLAEPQCADPQAPGRVTTARLVLIGGGAMDAGTVARSR
ncbi:hypothetical protein [Yinghuangia soli]|uniref:Uncharacterized protein n=1 Tax=Yinghuangia soli TaxID=2908204 RepID=A0AA41U2R5_9ACTN|nr:hypothetical protein [Yinghuangia soli]MCF2530970.1 hypothetical protein [Yinghuangia soli]